MVGASLPFGNNFSFYVKIILRVFTDNVSSYRSHTLLGNNACVFMFRVSGRLQLFSSTASTCFT